MTDVQEMVAALMTVIRSTERVRRQGQASTLSMLYIIAAHRRVRPSEIAAEMRVNPSSVTRQVGVLENAGQVKVVADPADGRSCFIELTASGQEEIRRLTEIGLRRYATFVEDWEAEEVRTLARLLAKLETSKTEVRQHGQRTRGRRWQKKPDEEAS